MSLAPTFIGLFIAWFLVRYFGFLRGDSKVVPLRFFTDIFMSLSEYYVDIPYEASSKRFAVKNLGCESFLFKDP